MAQIQIPGHQHRHVCDDRRCHRGVRERPMVKFTDCEGNPQVAFE